MISSQPPRRGLPKVELKKDNYGNDKQRAGSRGPDDQAMRVRPGASRVQPVLAHPGRRHHRHPAAVGDHGDSGQRTGAALKAADSFAGHATGKHGDSFA